MADPLTPAEMDEIRARLAAMQDRASRQWQVSWLRGADLAVENWMTRDHAAECAAHLVAAGRTINTHQELRDPDLDRQIADIACLLATVETKDAEIATLHATVVHDTREKHDLRVALAGKGEENVRLREALTLAESDCRSLTVSAGRDDYDRGYLAGHASTAALCAGAVRSRARAALNPETSR